MTTIFQLVMLGVVAAIMMAAMLPHWKESRRRLATIWARPCTGREWKRQFPDVPKAEIRTFLTVFTDSFAFSEDKRLKFRPSDAIMGVYQTLYPQQGWPDALEMESFVLCIEKTYRCTVTEEWKFTELTLGELFLKTRNPNHTPDGICQPADGFLTVRSYKHVRR